ncbi:ABC transporter ATP-binding protein [Neorhizobium alkalisoli]|uniref:Peptide/nickel transport system ATP-binding protein/oligopeptide transport system ATP-binding protein n=1 Tax=Neorhizobium alkalisoli TaxID=528178 RepID=A0A561R7Z2_9HYPH|nr:ABC transporter ATP-binding protein [Neorhizobium alkalisoli]TWF58733.1 peptide/nickel transport system ATP-binding protein/oligopeptide transport system ATP-binding protein [Neorhizobium alkalisoli]
MIALLDIQNYRLDIGTFDGPVHVLKGINLTVNRGDTLGIVGESGSGKTVLVRSVLGIGPRNSRVVEGSISFDGQDITALPEKDWTKIRGIRISMIFQDPMTYLNPLFSIGRQISDVIAAHEKAAGQGVSSKAARRARTEELLDQVGLPNLSMLFSQYPHQLSGGMRQRILIAMALAGKPDLLIADEPTTALDVTVQAQVLDLINSLVEKLNLTVIMISHDIGAIATVAKRCAVMYKGEIVEQGLTRDILNRPQHEYTQRLLAAVPDIDVAPEKAAARAAETPSAKPGHLLEAIDLKKVYRSQSGSEVTAVKSISLAVKTGEIFGVVGESGSGKSTLARMLLRLIKPTSGDIIFDGQNISGLSGEPLRQMRRHMQFVFQNPHSALNGRHTIGDAIGEPLRIQTNMSRRDIEARTEALLDIVQLPKTFKYRYPHELSGGQKQRVCIARAIALNPRLLILDEPTSALDISVQAQVLDFLQELRAELNLTYVFISHNLAVIRQICDRTIVMKRGEIVEQGETEQIFLAPREDYTKALIESGRKTSQAANL